MRTLHKRTFACLSALALLTCALPGCANRTQDSCIAAYQPVEYPDRITSHSTGMEFILVKPGSFQRGDDPRFPIHESFPDYMRVPLHTAHVETGFYLQTSEITNALFKQFMQESGYTVDKDRHDREYRAMLDTMILIQEEDGMSSFVMGDFDTSDLQSSEGFTNASLMKYYYFNDGSDDMPVVKDNDAMPFASYYDAVAFCKWLSKRDGRTYRLPSALEWEYANRHGHLTESEKAIELDALPLKESFKLPNALGLHNLPGGVTEWTSTLSPLTYETLKENDDPMAVFLKEGHKLFCIRRSVSMYGMTCYFPHERTYGFRVLCELPSQSQN